MKRRKIIPSLILLLLLSGIAAAQIFPIGGGGGGGGGGGAFLVLNHVLQADPVNGSDTTGALGYLGKPYKTLTVAYAAITAASWTSGTLYLTPGTFAQGNVQLVPDNGIDVVGSGEGQTIISSTLSAGTGSGGSAEIIPPSNCKWSNLTVNGAVNDGNYHYPIGIGEDDSLPDPTAFVLDHVTVIGDSDGLYFPNGVTSASMNCFGCTFKSSFDNGFFNGTGDIFNFWNCTFIVVGPNLQGTNMQHNITVAGNVTGETVRLFGCNMNVTSSSALHAQIAIDGVYLFSADNVAIPDLEMYGGTIFVQDTNNTTSTVPKAIDADGSFPGKLIMSGVNCNYPIIANIAQGVVFGKPCAVIGAPVPMTATASVATPPFDGLYSPYNNFTFSVDAGTLTSNKLTINNPTANTLTAFLSDGMQMQMKIKNTNASSTAMLLAVQGVSGKYNLNGFTLAPLAAGSTAYLEWQYNTTSSKWDLIGYYNGTVFQATNQASADLAGQTAAVSSIATYTTIAAGTFRIGGYVTLTAAATDILNFEVTWTDENSASRTQIIPAQNASGTVAVAIGPTTGVYTISPVDIRCATGSAITIKTVQATGGGTETYDVGASIQQVH